MFVQDVLSSASPSPLLTQSRPPLDGPGMSHIRILTFSGADNPRVKHD